MASTLDDAARRLLDGRNFATVATLDPDGSPHTSVVWYVRDGDDLLFSTQSTRRKARNLARDPRVALSVYDLANPYEAVDIRGEAELSVDEDRALPQRLTQRYLNQDARPEPPEIVRLIVRIHPRKVTTFSA
ncbi:MAG TPA: PPOX class F420-dependent oxidoreductase [Acidimicrobiales bacterium]|nr:PPOX class F420-dependent oxidoreductase [Acidimicrobiales bacterium]